MARCQCPQCGYKEKSKVDEFLEDEWNCQDLSYEKILSDGSQYILPRTTRVFDTFCVEGITYYARPVGQLENREFTWEVSKAHMQKTQYIQKEENMNIIEAIDAINNGKIIKFSNGKEVYWISNCSIEPLGFKVYIKIHLEDFEKDSINENGTIRWNHALFRYSSSVSLIDILQFEYKLSTAQELTETILEYVNNLK